MPTYSVLMPFVPRRPEQVLPCAALVDWTNAYRLWQGQALFVEPHHGFIYAAGAGFRVPAGLGVTLMGLRHPLEAAVQARSLAIVTGRPVVAGFGPGSRSFQASVREKPYASPLTVTREYVGAVRRILTQKATDTVGEYVSFNGELPPTPAPDVYIGVGVLRPGMARLAGEFADVAITWLTPAPYIRDVIAPALRAGAEAAGRSRPWLTAIVPMALARSDREPAELALASNRAHLSEPHYRDMLHRAGAMVSPDDDISLVAKRLVECGAFLSGDPNYLAGIMSEFTDAGVDEIVINVTGVQHVYGQQGAMADMKAILGEVA